MLALSLCGCGEGSSNPNPGLVDGAAPDEADSPTGAVSAADVDEQDDVESPARVEQPAQPPSAVALTDAAPAAEASAADPECESAPMSETEAEPEVPQPPLEEEVALPDSPPQTVDAILTLDPSGYTPLAALLEVTTPVETMALVEVAGVESWTVTFEQAALQHGLPLVGFKPGQHYDVTVRLWSDDAQVFESNVLSVDTAPLPEGFPEINLLTSIPDRMEPGHTLFPARMSGDYQIIVDEQGEVVWYMPSGAAWDSRQLPDGQLLFQDAGWVFVMDLLGNVSLAFEPDPADADYHHEVSPAQSGRFWTLGNRTVTAEAFPTDYDDLNQLETVNVTDDVLIELDPVDGVVQRIFLRDLLDPGRIAYDSLNSHVELGTPNDWAHANAIIEADDGQNLIVSCRHQDAIFKMKRDGSELLWILGNHNNWSEPFQQYLLQPVGDVFEWPYHQHAPEITPDGTILVFDNANYRASPSDGTAPLSDSEAESRVVEYRIDEQARTIEQVWEYYYPSNRYFSIVVGDADLQPQSNNVLATYGGMLSIDGIVNSELGRGRLQGRIVEIDRDMGDEVVFELEVYSSEPAGQGYFVYRAQRIPPIR